MVRNKVEHDEDGVISEPPRMGEDGLEYLNTDPATIPVRFRRPQSQLDLMRQVVQEMSARAQEHEMETWEEANDFDIGDDYEPSSQYEVDDTQEAQYELDRTEYHGRKRSEPRGSGKERSTASERGTDDQETERRDDVQPSGKRHSVRRKGTKSGGSTSNHDPDGAPDGVTD